MEPINDELLVKKVPVRMKIIGVGGAGGNAVNRMVDASPAEFSEVELISINTDLQALRNSKAPIVVQIGVKTTKGQGTGGDPEVGRQAAEESIDNIRDLLVNTDMLFLTCGMGKGTGTGATPVIAKVAREMDILTVAVVTKPFSLEGTKRLENAEIGISELRKYVDALLVIPNDKFLELYPNLSFTELLYRLADDVLYKAVLGIWNVVRRPGFVNVDYADAKNVLKGAGDIILSHGVEKADVENSLKKAIKAALNNPFVDVNMSGAKKLLVNIYGQNIISNDIKVASDFLKPFMDKQGTTVFIGYVNSEEFKDRVEVTIIASGFSKPHSGRKTKRIFRTEEISIASPDLEIKSEEDDVTEVREIKRFRTGKLRVLK